MSDQTPNGNGHSAAPSFSPTGSSIAVTKTIDTLLPFLLMLCAGLVYVVYTQLRGHTAEYTTAEIVMDLALLAVILVIAVATVRFAVRKYSVPAVTIPPQDRVLLEELIRTENTKAVELYVRLASLGGPTGTATKLGLTGLPLATIGLTIFFSIVALFVPIFLDLAKLTLGAFIGSFVQRSGEALERAVRATAPSELNVGSSGPAGTQTVVIPSAADPTAGTAISMTSSGGTSPS